MTLEDLKAQLRRDLSIQKLFNKEITLIFPSATRRADFYNSNKSTLYFAEPQVHIAQIVVTPTPDPTVHNLKTIKRALPTKPSEKPGRSKRRLKAGEDSDDAQNYSKDPTPPQTGGIWICSPTRVRKIES